MHKGYMGFIDEGDSRWENEEISWELTGVANSGYWNMDKVILKLISLRLSKYNDKLCCLNEEEVAEILHIAEVFYKASEDYTGKITYKAEWFRLGELLPSLWN